VKIYEKEIIPEPLIQKDEKGVLSIIREVDDPELTYRLE
jgi:hypothetical protein